MKKIEELIKKANVLIEALPYFKDFFGKTFVIKYGGSIMANAELKKKLIEDITLLKYVGINPVIVHGGGPAINQTLARVNIKANFIDGLRVTDQETMEIVEMVLSAKINKEIVASINQMEARAVGISGKDGNLIKARLKKYDDPAKDLGLVGEVKEINPELIKKLIADDYIPVIAPVGVNETGDSVNINADDVAGQIAAALAAEKLIYLTDVNGILADPADKSSRVSQLNFQEIKQLIENGKIVGGMLPKVEGCIRAVSNGVARTHILNGLISHPILLEIFTDQGIGTMIVQE